MRTRTRRLDDSARPPSLVHLTVSSTGQRPRRQHAPGPARGRNRRAAARPIRRRRRSPGRPCGTGRSSASTIGARPFRDRHLDAGHAFTSGLAASINSLINGMIRHWYPAARRGIAAATRRGISDMTAVPGGGFHLAARARQAARARRRKGIHRLDILHVPPQSHHRRRPGRPRRIELGAARHALDVHPPKASIPPPPRLRRRDDARFPFHPPPPPPPPPTPPPPFTIGTSNFPCADVEARADEPATQLRSSRRCNLVIGAPGLDGQRETRPDRREFATGRKKAEVKARWQSRRRDHRGRPANPFGGTRARAMEMGRTRLRGITTEA